jgi:nucleoside phosphorylase
MTMAVGRRAVILTALPVEYSAVRGHLQDLRTEHAGSTLYEVGTLEDGGWDVALTQVGPGNMSAAVQAQRAIDHFHPDVICFIGVAGGIKGVARGDVVVATKVYAYESGKDDGQLQARPEAFHSAFSVIQWAQRVALEPFWLKRLKASPPWPSVVVKPMAAGEKIVASTTSETLRYLRTHYNDAVAVDMESAGLLAAAWVNDIPAVVVRGVSDLLADKASSDAAGWQERAARNAAAFAVELLVHLELHGLGWRGPPGPDAAPEPAVGTRQTTDFFISHAGADSDWAEWIASILKANGYRVELDLWDWPAGSNFVVEMDRATREAERTLVVLTKQYLKGVYTQPEWAAALVTDPGSAKRKLVPVRVEPCEPRGLLAPIVYVDLVGLDETAATHALLEGVRNARRPSSYNSPFPAVPADDEEFPGPIRPDS